MDRIPTYLIAMIVAIANTPLDIYNVHAWNHGFVKLEPWHKRVSTGALAVKASLRGIISGIARYVWGEHRQLVSAVALLLCCLLLHPVHAGAAGVVLMGTVNIDALQRDLLKKSGEAASLLEKTMKACQAHEEKVDGKVVSTGRLMTDDEKKAIQALIDDGNGIKARIEKAKGDGNMSAEIARLTAGMQLEDDKRHAGARQVELRSMGQQFVESEAMAYLKKSHGMRGSAWTSPSVELVATTLDETTGSGGRLIVTEYKPGILPLLFKRLVVADLLASGTTDSSSVTYMKETTFTNAAAAVAEGAQKPESTLVFDQVTDLVTKIAHWLPVTDEMLEDVSQIASYIDARLRLGLSIAEEDQLLNGNGTAPNMTGLLNRSGLTTATVRSGSTTNADAIFTAQMAVFNASFVMPTGTVMNPANWQTTQLSKDGNGQYYGAGPFAGPQAPTLWGLPVAVTPSIVANTALTGAFSSAAQVFRKGGVRVEASNSHSDLFIRNLTAIRCEERAALAVYRPAAFSKIASLT